MGGGRDYTPVLKCREAVLCSMGKEDPVTRFIVIPLLAAVGMYVVGSFIGGALGQGNLFGAIFAAAGGVVTFGLYFKKQLGL
jgi:membrane associated rhomboid family serine protease